MFWRKLSSRKFWFGLVGAVVPFVVARTAEGMDMSTAAKLSAGVAVTYILAEAGVDITRSRNGN